MGGVNKMDQNVSKYRIAMRGKKWYWCLISYTLDISINNAWQLQKILYCQKFNGLGSFSKIYCKAILVTIWQATSTKKARKTSKWFKWYMLWWLYALGSCTRQTNAMRSLPCKIYYKVWKCDIGLHVKCFKEYHIPQWLVSAMLLHCKLPIKCFQHNYI